MGDDTVNETEKQERINYFTAFYYPLVVLSLPGDSKERIKKKKSSFSTPWIFC